MKTYIEEMQYKLKHSSNWTEQFEIIKALQDERQSCMRIIKEYDGREYRAWIKCKAICDHERELIAKIDNILNN